MSPIPLGILAASGAQLAAVGAFDLLQEEILTGAQASISFSSLDTYASLGYKHLQIRTMVRSDRAALADSTNLTFNSSTTGYRWHAMRNDASAGVSYDGGSSSYIQTGLITGNTNTASVYTSQVTDILNPFSSSINTTTRTQWGNGASDDFVAMFSGVWLNTTAVTSLTLDVATGSFVATSRVSLYGLKGA